MTARKQMLFVLAVLAAAPFAAAATTPELTHAPLSHWKGIAATELGEPTADDRGERVSYPLVSYGATPERALTVAQARDDQAAAAQDAKSENK
jgi:hypothetical protein